MIAYILFLLIVSLVSSVIILLVVDIMTGTIIPPIGYLYIVIAFYCRSLMVLSKKQFDEVIKGE
jgi:hypothetical protein